MKRLISLILTLALLGCGVAAAENVHLRISTVITVPSQEMAVDFDLYSDGTTGYLQSLLFPGKTLALSAEGPNLDVGESDGGSFEMIKLFLDAGLNETMTQCVMDWIKGMQPEIRTGMFSGDLFQEATRMARVRVNSAELGTLFTAIKKALNEKGMDADWLDEALETGNIPADLAVEFKIYDAGRYGCVNIFRGEEVVMTVSADLSDREKEMTTYLIGTGAGGKAYYRLIRITRKGENLISLNETVYADDAKTGFSGIRPEGSLICSLQAEVQQYGKDEDKQLLVSGELTPGNGMTPILFQGTIGFGNSGKLFEGRIRFADNNNFALVLVVSADEQEWSGDPAGIISMEDKDQMAEFATEIMGTFSSIMLQVMNWIPSEYMTKLMDF